MLPFLWQLSGNIYITIFYKGEIKPLMDVTGVFFESLEHCCPTENTIKVTNANHICNFNFVTATFQK